MAGRDGAAWHSPENGSCPLLAGWNSALSALMQPDMKIMFAFSFPQLSWCVMKLKLTVPYHQAGAGPVIPSAVQDRCQPESRPTLPAPADRKRHMPGPARGSCLSTCVTAPPWACALTFMASDTVLVTKDETLQHRASYMHPKTSYIVIVCCFPVGFQFPIQHMT